jgi:dihydroneopterin aldolase
MGEIALLGLEFYGRHGVMPEEGRLGARFVVDLWLEVAFEGKGDRLEETVDYAQVYALVEEAVRHRRFYLIEALADHLAETLLQAFPRLLAVRVRVHKPHAPIPGSSATCTPKREKPAPRGRFFGSSCAHGRGVVAWPRPKGPRKRRIPAPTAPLSGGL